ncbi:hypothetical protein [Microbacterium sp. No. 7]|uniref:hypothetical protein n=1 Tax=Microbacterium sp. No. 7 TaxID=1714373 RepID=UPI0006CFB1EA|nr:hypothetical protein [Microbacterium sp. No. 7]ALJ20808.1 hypothetical protein AOA12_13210 [Microbacterium sp. No. 7]
MIARALRARARGSVVDVVLLGSVLGGVVLSLSLAAGVPPEMHSAPEELRSSFHEGLGAVVAMYAALVATIFGAFRYTLDRRHGVVAQRLMALPRRADLVARALFSAAGGAVVAGAVALGCSAAVFAVLGEARADVRDVIATMVVGALAALWGLGAGLIVQHHLAALLLAPLSLSATLLLATLWPALGAWAPLAAVLAAAGFDSAAIGVADDALAPIAAAGVFAVWLAAILAGGAASFLRRDIAEPPVGSIR